ncbi:MAG TPA: TolC family protein [Mizugakiibacter sp.]
MSSSNPARRHAAALIALLLAWPLVAAAAEPPLTLDAAVALAVRDAPALAADASRATAARDDAVRVGRLPDPELTFGINNLPVQGPGAYTVDADPMTMRTIGLMQRIPSRAARDAARALAQAGIDAADAARVAAGEDVRRTAAAAWVALWADGRRRTLLAEMREEAETAVSASRARLAGGTGSAGDALAARGELAALDNRIDAADAAIDADRAALARWLGADAGRPLAGPPDFAALPVAPARLLAMIDRQAPLLPWTAREREAEAALAAARASKRPDWRVGANYGVRTAGRSDMVMLEVGVSLPLFARNRQDRAISARYAERDAAAAEHEAARRAQRAAVERTLADWQGWTRQVRRYRDTLLPLARDRTRAGLAAYRGGASLQAWLDARRDEIATRIGYADALDAWGRAWTTLAYLLPPEEGTP